MNMVSSQTALITGGSSGIGLEYSRQLADMGYSLILVSNREEELREAAAVLPGNVVTLCMDLSRHGAADELVRWCDARSLVPDVLICNAGMFFMEYLADGNLPKAQAMMALHMEVTTELCVLIGTKMKERGSGRILIMSSMAARIPAPGIAIYSASKAYLKSFGRSFSYEMRPFGVSVTTVCPAAVDTPLYPLPSKFRKAGRRIGLIRSPQWLARRALRAMMRGRRTVSPGLMNIIAPPLIRCLPSKVVEWLGLKWVYRAG